MTVDTQNENNSNNTISSDPLDAKERSKLPEFVRSNVLPDISRQVVRRKLAKQRHAVIEKAVDPSYLDSLFPDMLRLFNPQTVYYNGGIAQVPEWKISCYLEVMPGGVPTTEPNVELLQHFTPLLNACNELFAFWYQQQHACNHKNTASSSSSSLKKGTFQCHRLMTFITRYTPQPGEQALLKVSNFMRSELKLM